MRNLEDNCLAVIFEQTYLYQVCFGVFIACKGKKSFETNVDELYTTTVHPILYTTIFFFVVVIFNSVLLICAGFLTEQNTEIIF